MKKDEGMKYDETWGNMMKYDKIAAIDETINISKNEESLKSSTPLPTEISSVVYTGIFRVDFVGGRHSVTPK